MSQQSSSIPDPFQLWRDWVANSERQWNSFLNNAMATDEFSAVLGRGMDVYLAMQKNLNEVMGRYFTALNVPSRSDVLTLGDRLAAVEEKLAGLEVSINRLVAAQGSAPAANSISAPKPPRTKQPAKA